MGISTLGFTELKGLHWVKYFYRISGDPTIVDLKKFVFIQNIETSRHRT